VCYNRELQKKMKKLWNKRTELDFFKKTLKITSPESLFYIIDEEKYLAYWPKKYNGKKSTLQSRNAFIGTFTEKWVKDLLTPLAKELNAYAINKVVCEEIGLGIKSPADVAIVRTKEQNQKPENILLIIEVKMSLVWNWVYSPRSKKIKCVGDLTTHQGNPSLLRSDTMLKAIGKSINIRVSGRESSKIPIIIIGNTPITKTYFKKVDFLKKAGIIQGFYSVNPLPFNNKSDNENKEKNIKKTQDEGFLRIDRVEELYASISNLIREERNFFSSMVSKRKLGEIIDIASKETTYERKAERFLTLLEEN